MNWLLHTFERIKSSRRNALGFSILSSIVLLFLCYFADNIGYSLISGPTVGQRVEQFREFSGFAEDVIPEDVVFINVAYDRELVTIEDEYGLPKGNIDITNRESLTNFLSGAVGYRFLILDVLLSKEYQSPSDSLLISTLLKKSNLVIANSENISLLDSTLIPIAAFTDYSTDILETNFVKYEYSKNGKPTLPLHAFNEMTGDKGFGSFGPFYFKNGRLCWKSLTLRFPTKLWSEYRQDNGSQINEKILMNMGSDILETGIDIGALVKDKIVIVGDFTEDDIHDTYLGKIAGPVINLNALEALFSNELEIPWSLVGFLFLSYTAISYVIVSRVSLAFVTKVISKYSKRSLFTRYLISFIGISALLTCMAIVIYLFSGCDINIIIPSLWFTLLRGFTNSLNE